MPTRHVICCDGTWNKPDTDGNDIDDNTNVVKFRDSVVEGEVGEGWRQHVEYVYGVGTREEHKPDGALVARLRTTLGERTDGILGKVEGGTGLGVSSRIVQGYQYLCEHYQEGDEIYIVGFSRGAFTACSLAGMICRLGIVQGIKRAEAWVLYSTYLEHKHEPGELARVRAHLFAGHRHVNAAVDFLGVWDVVGSLGAAGGIGRLLEHVWGIDPTNTLERLHETDLHPKIKRAYHALALHEYRIDFKPTLWQSQPSDGQEVQQAWFAGAHSNVGGGYQHKLSAIPLAWLMARAAAAGLVFQEGKVPVIEAAHYEEDAYDSYTEFMSKFDLSSLLKKAVADGREKLLPAGAKEFLSKWESWASAAAGHVVERVKSSRIGGFLDDLLPDPPKPQAPDVKTLFPLYYRQLGELKNGTEYLHASVKTWLETVPASGGTGPRVARTLNPEHRKVDGLPVLRG
ncbi:MAG TPA: DUF2235 domain-containing protein [Prosthecobacter sp.]|nr:DUF2235 domain-containing protein [Prosthecobacter sp.]